MSIGHLIYQLIYWNDMDVGCGCIKWKQVFAPYDFDCLNLMLNTQFIILSFNKSIWSRLRSKICQFRKKQKKNTNFLHKHVHIGISKFGEIKCWNGTIMSAEDSQTLLKIWKKQLSRQTEKTYQHEMNYKALKNFFHLYFFGAKSLFR